MDKKLLQNYGWVVMLTLCLSVILSVATPLGSYVGEGVSSILKGFESTRDEVLGKDHMDKLEDEWNDVIDNPYTDRDPGAATNPNPENPNTCKHKTTIIANKKQSSCTVAGYTGDVMCQNCNTILGKGAEIAPTGHGATVIMNAKAPTCGELGYTGDEVCEICLMTLVRGSNIAKLPHANVSIISQVPATCLNDGYTGDSRCNDCNQIVEKGSVVAMLPHTVVNDARVEPTCVKTGLTAGTHCGVCNTVLVKQTVIAATGHNYVGVVTTNPTCTKEGIKTFTCQNANCGSYYTQPVSATGHTSATLAYKAPTCTATGLKQGSKCSVCNAILVAQEVIPATGHNFNTSSITTAPKCTTAGVRTYYCGNSNCSATRTEAISATGHTATTLAYKAPTCTATGLTEGSKCSVCSAILVAQQSVPAIGHNYKAVVTTAAKCTTNGVRTYTCQNCSHQYTESIPATGHVETSLAYKAPTCTETGLTAGTKCTVCGTVTKAQTVIAALGHSWGSWTSNGDTQHKRTCANNSSHTEIENHSFTTTTAPTCTTDGSQKCGPCGKTSTLPKTGHTWGSWTSISDTQHKRTCTRNSSHTETASHSFTTTASATCTANGSKKCGTCTKVLSIPATGHNYQQTTAPTCTTAGVKTCQNSCKGTQSIDALGHSWSSWAPISDTQHKRTCGRNSSHTETANHSFTTTTAATCTTDGSKKCGTCSKTLTISKFGHSWGAWTSASDTQHKRTCTNNSSHTETANHSFTVTRAATCTTDGSKKCGTCSKVLSIPATGHKAGSDDGSCLTAVKCANGCGTVTLAAKSAHSYTDASDTTCNNQGCSASRTVYAVVYNLNGGSGSVATQYVQPGQTITTGAATPTRSGYVFMGWSTNSDNTDDGYNWTNWTGTWNYTNGQYKISNNTLTLYARWTSATPYTINYNLNGGSGSISSQSVVYGNTITTGAGVPTRNGYTFAGWSTNSNNTDDSYGWTNWTGTWVYTNGQYGITNNTLTLYARWTPNTIKITLNANGGSGGTTVFYYKYGINTFYSDSACTKQITNITRPTRQCYSYNASTGFYGDGTSGGVNGERYVSYDSIIFASDLCTDIYKDATLTCSWTISHSSVSTINAVAATCTTKGYTGDSYCSGCRTTISTGSETGILGHSWGSWTSISDTQHKRTCSRNSSHTETANHSFTTTTNATCTTAGSKKCGTCSKTLSIAAHGHSWYAWTSISDTQHKRTCAYNSSHTETANHSFTTITAATCTANGSKKCGTCNTTATIGAHGHSWGSWTSISDTQHKRTCTYNSSHTETANHSFTTTTNATCTTDGSKKCGTCSKTLTIPKIGHSYGSWTSISDTQHKRTCTNNSSHTETANHSFTVTTAATCTTTGSKKCGTCNKTLTIAKTGHTSTSVAAVAATCTATGKTAGTKCSVCGTVLSGCTTTAALGHAVNTNNVDYEWADDCSSCYASAPCTRCGTRVGEWGDISSDDYGCEYDYDAYFDNFPSTCCPDWHGSHWWVLSDTFDGDCQNEAYTEWECEDCGDTMTEYDGYYGDHDYEEVGYSEGSCTEDGYARYSCTVCGDSYEEIIAGEGGHCYCEFFDSDTSCSDWGWEEYACCQCGDTEITSVPPTGCNWVVVEQELPYCGNDGYVVWECDGGCGDGATDTIPATDSHSWTTICYGPDYDELWCGKCGATEETSCDHY